MDPQTSHKARLLGVPNSNLLAFGMTWRISWITGANLFMTKTSKYLLPTCFVRFVGMFFSGADTFLGGGFGRLGYQHKRRWYWFPKEVLCCVHIKLRKRKSLPDNCAYPSANFGRTSLGHTWKS